MRFILWDPKDGNPRKDEEGNINTDGILGKMGPDNAYLTAYPVYPDETRPRDLSVGGRIVGVKYSLSGGKGYYDIIRVA
jgi:hypothetical protein